MSKIAALVLLFCTVLASPVLGVWKYKGTDVWISEPGSEYDPSGIWYYTWDGDGTVSAYAGYLDASGWTRDEAYVLLWPYFDDQFSASAYVESSVSACSHYEWEGTGSKNISYTVTNTVDSGSGLTYDGYAIDDTHVNTVRASSGADTSAGGGVTYGGSFYTGGYGSGQSVTQSGSHAGNGAHGNPTVSENSADWGYPAPYLYNQWYNGSFQFTADDDGDSRQCNWDVTHPGLQAFDVYVNVGGSCVAGGSVTISDPDFYYLRLKAEAVCYISGESEIHLYGNIQ